MEIHLLIRGAEWLSQSLQYEYQILKDTGTVSHAVAIKLAEKEYEKIPDNTR